MFTFYLFSFIPVVGFSLFLWIGIYRKKTSGKSPAYLLLSLVVFAFIGVILSVKLLKIYDARFSFVNFSTVCILYLVSFFLLEYSVHCQRIVKSFLMSDFRRKLKSLYWLIGFLSLFPVASFILYNIKDDMADKSVHGVFIGIPLYGIIHGIMIFAFSIFYFLANLDIKNNVFNLQKGVIRKEDVLFNSLIVAGFTGIPMFYLLNGLGLNDPVVILGFQFNGFLFETFLVLNIIYSIRLFAEYFFRRIYENERLVEKQNESMKLKNFLTNLVLTSPPEEDINIIKSTIKDSLERSMRSLVVTEYRITGTFILRRNGNILQVDSEELINGFCTPLSLLGGTNLKKKSNRQINDLILKKSYDMKKIANTPLENLPDWGEQLVKRVLSSGREYIVDKIPGDFLGLQRFIGLFPVISPERLDGIIVVFKESYEDLLPEERDVLDDLIGDLGIIFSITEGKRIHAERNRLQGEIDAARALQTAIVPREIHIAGYDCACYMETATEVGGDAYDYFPTRDGAYISIGDASGHGLAAGLAALIQQAAFQAVVYTAEMENRRLEPYQIYNAVNKVIYELNSKRIGSDKYMSQNYLYASGGSFRHAGAHEIALLYTDKEEKITDLNAMAGKTVFMGFLSEINAINSSGSFMMEEHDILVLYSDGIIQAKDYYAHQYGLEKLKHILFTHNKSSAEELIKEIVNDVKRHAESGDMKLHGGRLTDDITLIVIKKIKAD